jgi:hypothetical protein
LKLFQESSEVGQKRAVEGVNSSMIYLKDCKNHCKYSNIPPPSTTIIKKLKIKKIELVYGPFIPVLGRYLKEPNSIQYRFPHTWLSQYD